MYSMFYHQDVAETTVLQYIVYEIGALNMPDLGPKFCPIPNAVYW